MRFMHIADVHLGAAPDSGYSWSKDRGREIWDSFRRCIEDANEKKVDLLLIAGDLFHRQPLLQELREVDYLFSTLEKTMVVLIAGNHDYLKPSSPYLNFGWSSNVVCLFSPECEKVRLPELKTEVYGLSYHQQEITTPLYDGLKADKNDYFRILLAHGGDAGHIPISKNALMESGFDYIALGHIHKPQVFIQGLALYAGALEPIDCNDTGAHGYVLGEVQRKRVKLSFVESASRSYLQEEIEVTEQDTGYSLREKVAELIHREGQQNMYRIRFTGQRAPQFRPDLREYRKCGRILDIEDGTIPAFPVEELRRQYRGQLIGDFIESFGESPKGMVEEKALRYGLEALLYGDS
ncbi:MAG: DNA repair exonuclease [Lachnospiraceae bacterium]|nr:DNA repair exonuclease [Lachnospiraceae bacterium]